MSSRDVRAISLVGVAHGISHYNQLAFITMLLIVRQHAGLGFEDIGLLGAIFYGVSGVGQTAAGFAVDRLGARPILVAGLATIGTTLGLVSLAHSFAGLAAIAAAAGMGNCVFHPADFALINASVHHGRLGRAYSIHGLAGSLGWAAGPLMYFLDGLVGWQGAALIGAVPGLLMAVLIATVRGDLVDHRTRQPSGSVRVASAGGSLFFQAPILLCLAYFALLSISTVGIQQFAVPAWTQMFAVSQNHAALCLVFFLVGSALGTLVGGVFADRVRHHQKVASIGLVAAAVLTLPIALQTVSPALLAPLLALGGFAGGITNPSRDMIVRSATPPGASGKVFGFVYSGLDIGSFVSPPIFGFLMAHGLPAIIFWVSVAFYLANAAIVVIIRQAAVPGVAPAAAE